MQYTWKKIQKQRLWLRFLLHNQLPSKKIQPYKILKIENNKKKNDSNNNKSVQFFEISAGCTHSIPILRQEKSCQSSKKWMHPNALLILSDSKQNLRLI